MNKDLVPQVSSVAKLKKTKDLLKFKDKATAISSNQEREWLKKLVEWRIQNYINASNQRFQFENPIPKVLNDYLNGFKNYNENLFHTGVEDFFGWPYPCTDEELLNIEFLLIDIKSFDCIVPKEVSVLRKLDFLFLRGNFLLSIDWKGVVLGKLTSLIIEVPIGREEYRIHPAWKDLKDMDWDWVNSIPNLKYLTLRSCEIKNITENVTFPNSLKYLDLSKNELSPLSTIATFPSALKTLHLFENKLYSLPTNLIFPDSLEYLTLSYNELSSLPTNAIFPNTLKGLNLSNNQLSSLPANEILPDSLEYLSLSNNNLSSLPKNIVQLVNLFDLELDGNIFNEFPSEILELQKLESLRIDIQDLCFLPSNFEGLKSLKNLSVFNRQFGENSSKNSYEFPSFILRLENLEYLDTGEVEFINIPKEITKMKNLLDIYIGVNIEKAHPEIISHFELETYLED